MNCKEKVSSRDIIPQRRDIEERLKVVEEKSRIGDWEGDTITGHPHKVVIVTLVDRKSKQALMHCLDNRHATVVVDAMIEMLKETGALCHAITFDYGKEFADHQRISRQTGGTVYFATPYHSWERGLNEHTNGLVREDIPKSTNFQEVSDEDVAMVQDAINSSPRKVFGYRTSNEIVHRTGIELIH